MPFCKSLPGWLPISWLSIPPGLNFYSFDSKSNLTTYTTPHLTPPTLLATFASSFDNHLTFSYQILAISKAYYYHMRQLHCIGPYLDSTTACTTATSIIHSKLDYCTSLYYNLTESQITRLQQIQNSLAHAVAPKSCHITPILHSLHWLKITECIEYKLL